MKTCNLNDKELLLHKHTRNSKIENIETLNGGKYSEPVTEPLCKTVWQSCVKVYIHLPYNTAVHFWGIYKE